MPKVSFGTHPSGEDGISQDDPAVLVAHHFLGSWKSRKGWSGARRGVFSALRTFWHSIRRDLPEYRAKMSKTDKWYAMPRVNQRAGYPTSANWEPPFDVLTHVVGSDASVASTEAAGAALTARWGGGRRAGPSRGRRRRRRRSWARSRRTDAPPRSWTSARGWGTTPSPPPRTLRGDCVRSRGGGERALRRVRRAQRVRAQGRSPARRRLGGKGEAFCRALVASETDGEARDTATEAALRETTASRRARCGEGGGAGRRGRAADHRAARGRGGRERGPRERRGAADRRRG